MVSKTLIDNIFLNTIEYPSYSGNLTIQISDHLCQFVILEGFYKELVPKKINLYERNFKNFDELGFEETLRNSDWYSTLALERNDPNISMNNLYNHVSNLLDKTAPLKKLSKKDIKLKSWINQEIRSLMKKRDKLLHKYSKLKDKNSEHARIIHTEYKQKRNALTNMKRVKNYTIIITLKLINLKCPPSGKA